MADFNPSEEQKLLLAHDRRHHARVLAGPGTGKSATLVVLINRLLSLDRPPKVRLLTFTRAATAELAHKVSQHPVAGAERPSTVHSFAISVLVRNPGAVDIPAPLRIADDWERRNVVHRTLSGRAGIPVRRLEQLFTELAANWESLNPHESPKIDAAERARFQGAWQEHRRVLGYTLLQELPFALRSALADHPDLEGVGFDLLIVDEYQDLNACDLEVLRLVAERGCSVIGAGDDDQSIYSFRWAAPEGIRRFPEDYADARDYTLSVTQRCGSRIIEWARWVIEGDPDRPSKPPLHPRPDSADGQVALLGFRGHAAETQGIAELVELLVVRKGVDPSDVLILLRTDHNAAFSGPIKERLAQLEIPCSDPGRVIGMLEESENRRLLEALRLLHHRVDSLAWAALLSLAEGIGPKFFDHIYAHARQQRVPFGQALLERYEAGFPEAPRSSAGRANDLIASVLAWIGAKTVPDSTPDSGWGTWISETSGDGPAPKPSDELEALLVEIDDVAEERLSLGRYLAQIQPLGRDLALARGDGVRIMSMGGAKGLTVRATIIGALEEGVLPRPESDLGEERRLLYVGMTRAREFLYCTWARRRTGPTARAGQPRVGGRRSLSHFLAGGPVVSQDGADYLARQPR